MDDHGSQFTVVLHLEFVACQQLRLPERNINLESGVRGCITWIEYNQNHILTGSSRIDKGIGVLLRIDGHELCIVD